MKKRYLFILLSFMPICILGQEPQRVEDCIKSGVPPQYNGKHFVLGMYESLYNATGQDVLQNYHPQYSVELLFSVNDKGRVDAVSIYKSTGYDYLDDKILQLSKMFAKRHKRIKPACDENGEPFATKVLLSMSLHMFLPYGAKENENNVAKVSGDYVYKPSSQWYWSVNRGTDDNYKGMVWPEKSRSF